MKNKKIIILLSAVLLLCFVAGCDLIVPQKGSGRPDGAVNVTFVSSNDNYGSVVGYATQTIQPGKTSRQVAAYANDFCVFTGQGRCAKRRDIYQGLHHSCKL